MSFLKIFGLYHTTCEILVPWPRIKPTAPALAAWTLNHWNIKKVPERELL